MQDHSVHEMVIPDACADEASNVGGGSGFSVCVLTLSWHATYCNTYCIRKKDIIDSKPGEIGMCARAAPPLPFSIVCVWSRTPTCGGLVVARSDPP